MKKSIVMAGGILALVGFIVNVAVDFDNVYGMTLAALWALTLLLVLAGAFVGSRRPPGA